VETKEIVLSLLPTTVFFIGLLLLGYSELTLVKAVGLQNEVLKLFMEALTEADMTEALTIVWGFLLTEAVLPLLPFFLMTFVSLMLALIFLKKIKVEIAAASGLVYAGLLVVLGFSISLWLAAVGMTVAIFMAVTTFEPKKNSFSTGHSFVSSNLGTISFFLCLGIFLSIFMNPGQYEKQAEQANIELVSNMIDVTAAVELQKEQTRQLITGISSGYSSSLSAQYNLLSTEQQTQCGSMYDGLIVGLDSYETQALAQLDAGEIGKIDIGSMMGTMPLFEASSKAVSVTTTAVAYGFLMLVNLVLGLLGGIVNIFVGKSNNSGT